MDQLNYRGYELEMVQRFFMWHVGIHPGHPELPILSRCDVYDQDKADAIAEAKHRIDAALRL
jgi:hypothetical protein